MVSAVSFEDLLGEGRHLLDATEQFVEIGQLNIMTTGRGGDRALSWLEEGGGKGEASVACQSASSEDDKE